MIEEITEYEIHQFCKKHRIEKYVINSNMTVDTKGSVFINDSNLLELPFKFGVSGYDFVFGAGNLKSLKNCPDFVNGMFSCVGNKITSLIGAPKFVYGIFNCSHNNITSLHGIPQDISGMIFLHNNNYIEDDHFYRTLSKFIIGDYEEYNPSQDFYIDNLDGFRRWIVAENRRKSIDDIINS